MGWYEAVEAADLVVAASPHEAARFGVSVDRLTVSAAAGTPLVDVQAAIQGSGADVVILRYPAREVRWFAELAAGPRRAILADSLVYWSLPVGTVRRRPAADDGLSAGVERKIPGDLVDGLVADIFGAYGNHYIANPLFSPASALAGYQEWARRSVATAGAVTLRGSDGRVLGLGTLSHTPPVTEIELAGVIASERGRGRYSHLMAAMEDAAAAAGSDRLVISTQGHNTVVQRAWARYGFEPVYTLLTVHLIRDDTVTGRGEV
ncbi:MAG: GNAT family N-acetyltransferase [Kribbellaceae bacterium]